MKKYLIALLLAASVLPASALKKLRTEFGDSTKTHVFTLSANMITRGEWRKGDLPNKDEDFALFVYERTRLTFNYSQPHLEIQISPQHQGVWGTTGGGSFSLYEAWARVYSKTGVFGTVGRQSLTYDDERIIGQDDWSMTGSYHDALKFGYEGFGHKVHAIVAYNQNNANTGGGTYYTDGDQVYKNMQILWYHYDFKKWFAGSLLFINTGMQSKIQNEKKNYYQQLAGAYAKFTYPHNGDSNDSVPRWLKIEGSYYHQWGTNEYKVPINAWMASVEINGKVNDYLKLNTGYFHLSGDENYYVPPEGAVGLARPTHANAFNLLFGSHHQFYGAMEFFYMSSYYGGYAPGLQDFHVGSLFSLKNKFSFEADYHYLATTIKVRNHNKTLGHELVFEAKYNILDNLTLSAGYSFMKGTSTMDAVKRSNSRDRMHWAYLMLTFKPKFLTVRF